VAIFAGLTILARSGPKPEQVTPEPA
jgi:hypothetical protein